MCFHRDDKTADIAYTAYTGSEQKGFYACGPALLISAQIGVKGGQ